MKTTFILVIILMASVVLSACAPEKPLVPDKNLIECWEFFVANGDYVFQTIDLAGLEPFVSEPIVPGNVAAFEVPEGNYFGITIGLEVQTELQGTYFPVSPKPCLDTAWYQAGSGGVSVDLTIAQ